MLYRRLLLTSFFLIALSLFSAKLNAQTFNRGIDQSAFVPKGQWLFGGSLSYSENSNDNFKWLVLEDITAKGYNFKISPYFAYFVADNIALGGRFIYSRNFMDMGNVSLNLGDDLSFNIKDYTNTSHMFYGTFFARTYINLGENKRFGLYNEARISMGWGEGKNTSGSGDLQTGTFQKITEFQLGISPGMTVFINDFTAVDVSVGVMGFNFKWIDQLTNQVEHGKRRESSGNFKIDIFSISLGISFYL